MKFIEKTKNVDLHVHCISIYQHQNIKINNKKNKPVITGILNGVKKNENSKSRINKRLAAEL